MSRLCVQYCDVLLLLPSLYHSFCISRSVSVALTHISPNLNSELPTNTDDPSRTDKQFNGMAEPVEVIANRELFPYTTCFSSSPLPLCLSLRLEVSLTHTYPIILPTPNEH